MIRPEDYGAIGDGVSDDLAAFQAALAVASAAGGDELCLKSGATYRLSASLAIPARCGIVGQRSATILAKASDFNNTCLSKYLPNSTVLNLNGALLLGGTPNVSPYLHGFTLQSEVQDGRLVDAITANNVIDLHLSDLEIFGFPVGCDIRAGSLQGGQIRNCLLHNRSDNQAWSGASGPPQLTAIEIDNDRYNGGSLGTVVYGNRIRDLTVGSVFNTAWGYQTDGINVASSQAGSLVIADNDISGVGEGIDFFGCLSALTGNVIRDAYVYGIKLIHGATSNAISGGAVYGAGWAPLLIAGTNTPGIGPTRFNTVTGVLLSSPNQNGAWGSVNSACIKLDTGTVSNAVENLVTGCTLYEAAAGKYGWLDGNPAGSNNIGEGLRIATGAANVRRVSAPNANVRLAGGGTYYSNLI